MVYTVKFMFTFSQVWVTKESIIRNIILQSETAGLDVDMGAMKKNPRYNVVSLRISDAEKETLTEIARRMDRSISDVMREAVGLVQMQMGKRVSSR